MQLGGNKKLSKWFMPFLMVWALLIGEILPVCLENRDCFPQSTPVGGKESMFSGPDMFIPTLMLYGLLSVIFWLLFRAFRWTILIMVAAILGAAMEFLVFKPQETGVNVVDNPIGSLVFFVIIWPVLLIAPYGIFQFLAKKLSASAAKRPV